MAILLALIAGVILGIYLKSKLPSSDSTSQQKLKAQLDDLLAENEKIHSRAKAAERQVEDLLSENKKIRSKSKAEDDDRADLEDEVSSLKSKLRKVTAENETLSRDLKEAKEAYYALENQMKK